ncbi:MAG: protein kinase [Candidatus Aminicenantes bacterium]|nr:protein kinase [Candidatus Aminicenantes bacterium]NIM82295.1 protein kinase [Candidatus Aminicenantes bacterium]NIN21678.1 protein kinase [Candidatus Aminicenantes bacterium]NIN45487.1 protein kinase [Candidatus Aminicenantes bacterium]NIN88318.1 protein kinase [Candidatus Aminicenantes bacterium]
MIGQTVSHYKILEKLGEGGMGVVYKAEDTKLKRDVSLKFLPKELTRDQGAKERFQREAQAAAALNHPNIITIYEIDEFEGQIYISMEYVKGRTLKEKICEGGVTSSLEIIEILDIAAQLLEGLANAHQAGIVHRDIKPQNILIDNEARVKILDFGLAKLKGVSQLTKESSTLGTAHYISPEQALAKDVDHRTDIWSLGVVLYEMITGQLPFKGEYEQSVLYSIMNEEPEPLPALRTGVPMELERIVNKSLAKETGNRYQNAGDILADLMSLEKKIESGTEAEHASKTKPIPSIAVMAFADMSPGKDQEYFCDGMAEEIINSLTHIKNLRVIARTSAFQFKGKNVDAREIGKKLDVETLLEGSVRKAGNRLRITAQLIKVDDGSHIWSERYDREMEDVFDIQDEISLAIVEELKITLLGHEKARILKSSTKNIEAYNLYLKGRFYAEMLTPEGFKRAIECFEKALEKDRNYAQAYVGLGLTLRAITFFGNISPRECLPKLRKYAEKALEINKNSGEAYHLLALYHMNYQWNCIDAEEKIKKALKLSPNSYGVHLTHSFILTQTGRHDEAVAAAKRARELDPISGYVNYYVGQALFFASRFDESIADLKVSIEMNPNYWPLHYVLGCNYWVKSMVEDAFLEYEKAYTISSGVPWITVFFAAALYRTGEKDRAMGLIETLVERSEHEYIPPMCFYGIYREIGELDKAYPWLEKAFEEHDNFIRYFIVLPVEMLPQDPRLIKMFKEKGLKK